MKGVSLFTVHTEIIFSPFLTTLCSVSCRSYPEEQRVLWRLVCKSFHFCGQCCVCQSGVEENWKTDDIHRLLTLCCFYSSAWFRPLVPFISPPRVLHLYPLCLRREERSDMASSQRSFSHCCTPRPVWQVGLSAFLPPFLVFPSCPGPCLSFKWKVHSKIEITEEYLCKSLPHNNSSQRLGPSCLRMNKFTCCFANCISQFRFS